MTNSNEKFAGRWLPAQWTDDQTREALEENW